MQVYVSPVAAVLLTPLLLLLYLISRFIRLLVRQHLSPLRRLPGPPSPSFFMGNLAEMHDQENNNLVARWEAVYGSSFVYKGFIGGCRLMTTDPVAVAHILGHAYDYPKPDFVRDSLATMIGGHDGLLTVEGEAHQRQRKILAPAFSSSHIKSLTPIFWDKATELRDIWLQSLEDPQGSTHHSESPRVDVLSWLAKATLDVIGLAGFGYAFHSLTSDTDELAKAFGVIFSTARKFRVMTILQVWFPILRRFRRNSATMTQAQETMSRIGMQLIEEKKRAVMLEKEELCWRKGAQIDGNKASTGRDLLSVLIRSNLAATSSQSMSTNEVLSQISTFLAAGHETTASAMTWCLYALVKNPEAQRKLRRALRDIEREESKDCLEEEEQQQRLTERISRCEYLDWVVRESLRVHAPVTNTMRVCMRDEDEIPLSQDACGRSGSITGGDQGSYRAGGYLDKTGQRRWGIKVKKWDIISIPIQAINKSQALWGKDAQDFRPERWEKPPQDAKAIPGLYANTLTFLNGNGNPLAGNRACIGYKFALIEIKIFLYVLLKDIEFSIDPSMVIEKKVNVVTRPCVKFEPHLGNQMPLYIQRAPSAATTTTTSSNLTDALTPPDRLSPTLPSPASSSSPTSVW